MNKRSVVVTTENRGVFFGYLSEEPQKLPNEITLEQARMCIYWSSDVRGVLGLAATGPNKACRITYAVPQLTAYKITAIIDCTPEAQENWEKNLWS